MDIPWDELLLWIEEKGLIPIVGQDLLIVETDSGPMPFYDLLAKKLAEDLRIPPNKLPPKFDFNDILAAHPPFQKGTQKIHAKLKLTYDKLAAPAVPEPLRKLASIKPLKLFVTTTFDTFLERALNDVRGENSGGGLLAKRQQSRSHHGDARFEPLDRLPTPRPDHLRR
jgi:hypothetical protein